MIRTVFFASVFLPAVSSFGATMPFAQQDLLVQKYCAVCHTDSARNGGLSLQHFSAAHVAPDLAAMLISKLTGGASVATANAAASDAAAAALIDRKMKGGAMGAAGIPIPDKPTIDGLIHALAVEADGATRWHVETSASPVIASILREVPMGNPNEVRMYRLVLACDNATHAGGAQLSWSPAPTRGTFAASIDGASPVTYRVEGSEKMGNGAAAITGPAAFDFRIPMPEKTLRIEGLFPDESIDFPFADLPAAARGSLAACFDRQASANIQLH